jgi:heme/copper-type cytochrome/quinol oxidase subunit 1
VAAGLGAAAAFRLAMSFFMFSAIDFICGGTSGVLMALSRVNAALSNLPLIM